MKFNCGLTPEEKEQAAEKWAKKIAAAAYGWHDHFAWWPVRVGSGDCRWLETVERRFPRMVAGGVYSASLSHKPLFYNSWTQAARHGWCEVEYRPKQQRGDE